MMISISHVRLPSLPVLVVTGVCRLVSRVTDEESVTTGNQLQITLYVMQLRRVAHLKKKPITGYTEVHFNVLPVQSYQSLLLLNCLYCIVFKTTNHIKESTRDPPCSACS